MRVVGANQARSAILRYLAQDEEKGCTSGQIARDLDIGAMTVFRHLGDLEDLRVVETNEDGDRNGVRVLYRLNRTRLNEELTVLQSYLNGH